MLSREYDVKELCDLMGVSRAGFYKWKKRGKPAYQDKRELVISLVTKIHTEHPSHGYRWVAAYIRINEGTSFSDNYVYKAFRYLGFKSETKHKEHSRPRKVKDKFPNLIYTTWDTVDRPRQVIVSDMTVFHVWWFYIEVTFYFDVFTKQILTWKMAERRGDRSQYIDGMVDVVSLLRGSKEPTIVHTDQGSVYASMAYNDLIKDENGLRLSLKLQNFSTFNPPTLQPRKKLIRALPRTGILAPMMEMLQDEEYAEYLEMIPMPEKEEGKDGKVVWTGMSYSDVAMILNHFKSLGNRYFRKRF